MRTIEAISIGNAAANLQTNVRTVERVAAKLRLEPVLLLDGVRHFDGNQIERIRNQIRGTK